MSTANPSPSLPDSGQANGILEQIRILAGRIPKPLLTPEQAAGILGVTAGTLNVWRATRRYPLPYVKIGRKVMYDLDHVLEFAASRTVSPICPTAE